MRPAEPREWEEIAEGLHAFNGTFAFAPHFTASKLSERHAERLLRQSWRHSLVATDNAGNILTGIGMTELPRLSVLKAVAMPPVMRLLNAAIHIVPADGTLRLVQVEKAFSCPGVRRWGGTCSRGHGPCGGSEGHI